LTSAGLASSLLHHSTPQMLTNLSVVAVWMRRRLLVSMAPTLLHPTTPCSATDAEEVLDVRYIAA
jgi:hypothetical protein